MLLAVAAVGLRSEPTTIDGGDPGSAGGDATEERDQLADRIPVVLVHVRDDRRRVRGQRIGFAAPVRTIDPTHRAEAGDPTHLVDLEPVDVEAVGLPHRGCSGERREVAGLGRRQLVGVRLGRTHQQRHARPGLRAFGRRRIGDEQARAPIPAHVARVLGEVGQEHQRVAVRVEHVGHHRAERPAAEARVRGAQHAVPLGLDQSPHGVAFVHRRVLGP